MITREQLRKAAEVVGAEDSLARALEHAGVEVEPEPPSEPELPTGPWRTGIHASGSVMISAGRITYYSTEPLGRRMISAAIAAYNAQPAAIPEQEREAVRRLAERAASLQMYAPWLKPLIDALPAWARKEPKS